MNRPVIAFLLMAFFAVGVITVSGQAPEKPQQGFLSPFKKGQSINVKEVEGRFEISTFDDGQTMLSHKIVEVGLDYLTLEDIAGVSETRIPVFTIKSMVTIKVPK